MNFSGIGGGGGGPVGDRRPRRLRRRRRRRHRRLRRWRRRPSAETETGCAPPHPARSRDAVSAVELHRRHGHRLGSPRPAARARAPRGRRPATPTAPASPARTSRPPSTQHRHHRQPGADQRVIGVRSPSIARRDPVVRRQSRASAPAARSPAAPSASCDVVDHDEVRPGLDLVNQLPDVVPVAGQRVTHVQPLERRVAQRLRRRRAALELTSCARAICASFSCVMRRAVAKSAGSTSRIEPIEIRRRLRLAVARRLGILESAIASRSACADASARVAPGFAPTGAAAAPPPAARRC